MIDPSATPNFISKVKQLGSRIVEVKEFEVAFKNVAIVKIIGICPDVMLILVVLDVQENVSIVVGL